MSEWERRYKSVVEQNEIALKINEQLIIERDNYKRKITANADESEDLINYIIKDGKVICKACDGSGKSKQKGYKGGGCPGCGGYGHCLEVHKCHMCDRKGLFRVMRGVTSYEGKRFYSVDGLEMVSHNNKPANCIFCED